MESQPSQTHETKEKLPVPEPDDEDNKQEDEKADAEPKEKKKGKKLDPELIENYKKLIEYKNNLFKLEALISIERNEATREELLRLKNDLVQVIHYHQEAIKTQQGSPDFYLSTERLTSDDVDRIAKAFLETEGKWYNAHIHSVDVENQEAEMTYIGFKDIKKQHAVFVKVAPKPNPQIFEPGTYCDALYSGDGHYYPCVIEKVSEAGYHVKFKKYNNREVVPLIYLRESKNADNTNKKKYFDDTTEFKIPDNLKILPNDSEAQRQAKKKKTKALKASYKQSLLDKDSREKQDKWNDFKSKGNQAKEGYFHGKKTESMFRSPDTIEGRVGVIGSGKGMTNFNPKMKYSVTDNSYLSRLF